MLSVFFHINKYEVLCGLCAALLTLNILFLCHSSWICLVPVIILFIKQLLELCGNATQHLCLISRSFKYV